MKRYLVIATAIALVFGFALGTIHRRNEAPPPAPTSVTLGNVGKFHLDSIRTQNPASYDCAIAGIGFGVTVVGAAVTGGGSALAAWLGFSSGAIGLGELDRACAADSFYNHVGFNFLCWQQHFLYWSPFDGKPVFDNRTGLCSLSPKTADYFLCQYLHPAAYQDACTRQFWFDVWAQTSTRINAWIF